MFLFFALIAAALGAPGWMAVWLILDALDTPRRRGWCLFAAIVFALLQHPALALVCAVLAYLWGDRERTRRARRSPGEASMARTAIRLDKPSPSSEGG